ncbi:MAG TPA: ECF-type sigma factor [Bryobacteraceae bacterium]|nr:ECF-type sigma factor [Bryobacteraceae bacterium]
MPSDVSELLQRWRQGDSRALDELMPLVYGELHRIAEAVLHNQLQQTLQPTALINEAYLKLFDGAAEPQFADRAHFLAVMARVMRHVLIDHARTAAANKRGGQNERVSFDTAVEFELGQAPQPFRMLDLDHALGTLEIESPSLARVVEAHYFGGMTAEEISTVEGRSPHAIRHDLRLARAWLRRELDR